MTPERIAELRRMADEYKSESMSKIYFYRLNMIEALDSIELLQHEISIDKSLLRQQADAIKRLRKSAKKAAEQSTSTPELASMARKVLGD